MLKVEVMFEKTFDTRVGLRVEFPRFFHKFLPKNGNLKGFWGSKVSISTWMKMTIYHLQYFTL